MISPKLYRSSRLYDFFLKWLGYERSLDRFLAELSLRLKDDCCVLDAGCGTGVLGLHFLERFGRSTLVASDLEPNFLQATLENADRRGLSRQRITVGQADIGSPRQITLLDGTPRTLDDGSFNVICVGAVVGYASDTAQSLRELVRLLAPGGYLINLEMNESITGRFVAHRYHYHNISLDEMRRVLHNAGCEELQIAMRWSHLPAKLTRTAIVAQKRHN